MKVGCCLLAVALINAGGGLAEAAEGGRIAPPLFRPNANPTATSPAPNRATVGGTVMTRPGSGLSRLGGPARPVGAINGSAITRKH